MPRKYITDSVIDGFYVHGRHGNVVMCNFLVLRRTEKYPYYFTTSMHERCQNRRQPLSNYRRAPFEEKMEISTELVKVTYNLS
jgi:hypothetical protein